MTGAVGDEAAIRGPESDGRQNVLVDLDDLGFGLQILFVVLLQSQVRVSSLVLIQPFFLAKANSGLLPEMGKGPVGGNFGNFNDGGSKPFFRWGMVRGKKISIIFFLFTKFWQNFLQFL